MFSSIFFFLLGLLILFLEFDVLSRFFCSCKFQSLESYLKTQKQRILYWLLVINWRMHTHIHACTHTFMHSYIHASMHSYIHTCYIHTWIVAYLLPLHFHNCFFDSLSDSLFTYLHTCLFASFFLSSFLAY